jgi:hypothetical protein
MLSHFRLQFFLLAARNHFGANLAAFSQVYYLPKIARAEGVAYGYEEEKQSRVFQGQSTLTQESPELSQQDYDFILVDRFTVQVKPQVVYKCLSICRAFPAAFQRCC